MRKVALIIALLLIAVPACPAWAVRLGDLIAQECVRANLCHGGAVCSNYVSSHGLVVGLDGTGDQTDHLWLQRSMDNVINDEPNGIAHDLKSMDLSRMAAVRVVCRVPIFGKPGDKIDVSVESTGDATSLENGTLLPVSCGFFGRGNEALAQGPVKIDSLMPTKGHVVRGGEVTKVTAHCGRSGMVLQLKLASPDGEVAARVAQCINAYLTESSARSVDDSTVEFTVPEGYDRQTQTLIDELRNLEIMVPDTAT